MRYVYRVRCSIVVAMLAALLLVPSRAAAQDLLPDLSSLVSALDVDVPVTARPTLQPEARGLRESAERPGALLPLYASLGALQALDVHSTSRGLARGGREANPVMDPVVGNRAAFIGVKAVTTAGVIWASERLWRKQNRKAAVILTALTNIGLAAVVANNYRVAK